MFVLPLILLQALLFPLKILFALKIMALVNSFFIGTFLFRLFFGRGIFGLFKNRVPTKNILQQKNHQLTEDINEQEASERKVRQILSYISKQEQTN